MDNETNLSKIKRKKMMKKIEELKQDADDDLYAILNEIENELDNKYYGLVWEKHIENVDVELETKIPVFSEWKEKKITKLPEANYNFLLEGDNLHSLYLLEKTLKGRIDCIYIDPPFNTGSDDFAYNDKKIDLEDDYRHSKWLSFMERRLKLAKRLLKPTGAIFISIDDNEYAQLKLLCDSIFDEKNMLVNMIVTSAPAGTQSSTDFAIQHSYCLAYKMPKFKSINIELTEEELDAKYNLTDERGNYYLERIWKRGQGGRKEDSPNLHFPVYYDIKKNKIYIDEDVEKAKNKEDLVKIIPYQTVGVLGRWSWSKEKMRKQRKDLEVKYTSGEYKLYKKMYRCDDSGKKPFSIIGSDIGRTELGSLELKDVLDEKAFAYPKPVELIKHIINCSCDKNGIVLDFFAGSGTTGQAVLELNEEDDANRKFILATNNEISANSKLEYLHDEGYMTDYTPGDGTKSKTIENKINSFFSDNQDIKEKLLEEKKEKYNSYGICRNVTYRRLKTVITGKREDNSYYSNGLPANLMYFKTDFVNKKHDGTVCDDLLSHIKEMIQIQYFCEIDNVENILVFEENELDERMKLDISKCKKLFKPSYVLLTSEQEEMLKNRRINIIEIPERYFRNELLEVDELC